MKFAVCFLVVLSFFCFTPVYSSAETLKAGIAVDDYVPEVFYGTWRVNAKLIKTDSQKLFKNSTVDLWNISRSNNVITLENPATGAKASITVTKADSNGVTFEKESGDNVKNLHDRVELNINNDTFEGVNYITVKTYSTSGKDLEKVETAKYSLYGEKISGFNVLLGE